MSFDDAERVGSAGFQPVVLGILPSTCRVCPPNRPTQPGEDHPRETAGRMPAAAGWKPAVPEVA